MENKEYTQLMKEPTVYFTKKELRTLLKLLEKLENNNKEIKEMNPKQVCYYIADNIQK